MEEAASLPHLGEAIAFFLEMTCLAGCPFEGDIEATRYLPTILGDFQCVALAPAILWNSAPRDEAVTAIAGFRGLSSFDECFVTERLSEQARRIGSTCTYIDRQIALPGDFRTPVNVLHVAKRFDSDPGFRAAMAAILRQATAGCDCILVPGVLGTRSCADWFHEFESEVRCPVGEIPTLPPSIPGLRLFHCLESYLQKLGVELFRGFPVESVKVHSDSGIDLRLASPGHATILHGDSVVLAVGRQSDSLLRGTSERSGERMPVPDSTQLAIGRNLFVPQWLPHGSVASESNVRDILAGYSAGKLAVATRSCNATR
jgi:glycerol-3-phosphate dehydrogenase subunit B